MMKVGGAATFQFLHYIGVNTAIYLYQLEFAFQLVLQRSQHQFHFLTGEGTMLHQNR